MINNSFAKLKPYHLNFVVSQREFPKCLAHSSIDQQMTNFLDGFNCLSPEWSPYLSSPPIQWSLYSLQSRWLKCTFCSLYQILGVFVSTLCFQILFGFLYLTCTGKYNHFICCCLVLAYCPRMSLFSRWNLDALNFKCFDPNI